MTDLELARQALPGHTLALCKNGEVLCSDLRGLAPMVRLLREGRDLTGYSAADRVVGRAAALLFLKAGIRELYADTLSEGAAALLTAHGLPFSCCVRTERILNRAQTDLCPMEQAVVGTDDPALGWAQILQRLEELQADRR